MTLTECVLTVLFVSSVSCDKFDFQVETRDKRVRNLNMSQNLSSLGFLIGPGPCAQNANLEH